MEIEIVPYHHITRLEYWGKLSGDICVECFAIHRPVDDPWGDQFMAFERSDEGLCIPIAEGCLGDQSTPFLAAAS